MNVHCMYVAVRLKPAFLQYPQRFQTLPRSESNKQGVVLLTAVLIGRREETDNAPCMLCLENSYIFYDYYLMHGTSSL